MCVVSHQASQLWDSHRLSKSCKPRAKARVPRADACGSLVPEAPRTCTMCVIALAAMEMVRTEAGGFCLGRTDRSVQATLLFTFASKLD